MNKKTLKALQGSIEKWRTIIKKQGVDNGVSNCPLCHIFFRGDCEGCPVMQATGERECENSPYEKWEKHHNHKHSGQIGSSIKCPTCTRLAKKELAFLESLLPQQIRGNEG